MKKVLLLVFISTLFCFNSFAQSVAYDTCITGGAGGGNIVIFANYDGGVLNINVDQNIPNLKIGICTYEPVTINLSGPFLANVTEVRYAGYVSTTNHHCANSPTTSTIIGAPGGAIVSVNFTPPATLSNPNGNPDVICAFSCDNSTNQGGCNTADQIVDYFETSMGGTLYSYYTQYGCWSVAPYNISAGGNCPFAGAPDTTITIFSSSSTTVCVGETVNFTDTSPGAVSWNWTASGSSNPSASTQNINNVFWTASGSYTVSLSTNDGDGTCSASQTITVLDNPTLNPTATPNPICNGDTTNLLATGAFLYQWNPGGPSTNTWMVSPSIDTWYFIMGTDINGCITHDSVLVMVNPIPSTPTINYSGGILTASPSATSYQWYLNGNPIAGATSQNYTPTQNGNYTVIYTDANGCESALSTVTTVSNVGIENYENTTLHIYPNPGTGIFQLNLASLNDEKVKIDVMDALGKIIYSKQLIFHDQFTLDLTDFPKGVYQVNIISAKKVFTSKLILK